MHPKENLPQQICDLCIVQLNVSYNFKRLALKNDFQIRQYMIENGMNLTKEDEETPRSLEIHQIQHNVIRTNCYRQIAGTELRRNSTTSSVSGASTMLINGIENSVPTTTSTTNSNSFVHPRPIARPIQIKVEPVDPEEEQRKVDSPVTSSPSNSSEPASIVTIYSSNVSEKRTTPMVVINGIVNNDSFKEKLQLDENSKPAPLSVKLGRPKNTSENIEDRTKEKSHNLRTIKKKKKTESTKSKKKLQQTAMEMRKRPTPIVLKGVKKANFRIVSKSDVARAAPRPRGRPRKNPGAPKTANNKGKNDKKS